MAWQEAVTVDRVIELLNELIELDREAVSKLIDARVTCSQALADHPTVQVGQREDGTFRVGVIGLLNGLFGVDEKGYGPIMVRMLRWDEEADLLIMAVIRTDEYFAEQQSDTIRD